MPFTFRDSMIAQSGPTRPAAVPLAARYALEGAVAASSIDTPGLFQKPDGTVWLRDSDGNETQVGSGGSTPGALRVLGPFPFAFNTAGLADGVAIWTPAADDILFEAWVSILTAFNGTTPLADIGTFTGGETMGWIQKIRGGGQAIDLGNVDANYPDPAILSGSGDVQSITTAWLNNAAIGSGPTRYFPGKHLNASPIKVVASQDGTQGGTALDSSAGAAAVYLLVATPSLT